MQPRNASAAALSLNGQTFDDFSNRSRRPCFAFYLWAESRFPDSQQISVQILCRWGQGKSGEVFQILLWLPGQCKGLKVIIVRGSSSYFPVAADPRDCFS
jgi:hypothetical protein